MKKAYSSENENKILKNYEHISDEIHGNFYYEDNKLECEYEFLTNTDSLNSMIYLSYYFFIPQFINLLLYSSYMNKNRIYDNISHYENLIGTINSYLENMEESNEIIDCMTFLLIKNTKIKIKDLHNLYSYYIHTDTYTCMLQQLALA